MSTRKTLKALAEARRGVLVPGAFNALSAKVIEDLGFEAIYITGAGVTNMWFGMPDQGFMGLAEIADHTARIAGVVNNPPYTLESISETDICQKSVVLGLPGRSRAAAMVSLTHR